MANFSITLKTQSVRVFGEGPSTKWGNLIYPYTMTWGTSKWGEGAQEQFSIEKVISNTVPTTWDKTSSDVIKTFEIASLSAQSEMGSEVLTDGSGLWTYVFPSNATDGETRDFASWTSASFPDATFTCQAAGSTSWSEV